MHTPLLNIALSLFFASNSPSRSIGIPMQRPLVKGKERSSSLTWEGILCEENAIGEVEDGGMAAGALSALIFLKDGSGIEGKASGL